MPFRPYRDDLMAATPSRHPFQLFLLGSAILQGAGAAFGFGRPPSLELYAPLYFVVAWGYIVMVGGTLGLIAAAWPDRITGLLMERLALMAVAIPTGLYGYIAFKTNGPAAWALLCSSFGLVIASAWRTWQIRGELQRTETWIGMHSYDDE